MYKYTFLLSLILLFALGSAGQVQAHCEIPCGIYGDEVRFYILEEHITTIEKSMTMITELSAESEKNYNQLVRWIDNKETHAGYFQEIISQYFMTQRVKPAEPEDEHYQDYLEKITLLHRLLIGAMKAKQTTDVEVTKELTSLLSRFRKAYFGAEPGAHRPPGHEHEGH
jgi:nickel superoxide dismutase